MEFFSNLANRGRKKGESSSARGADEKRQQSPLKKTNSAPDDRGIEQQVNDLQSFGNQLKNINRDIMKLFKDSIKSKFSIEHYDTEDQFTRESITKDLQEVYESTAEQLGELFHDLLGKYIDEEKNINNVKDVAYIILTGSKERQTRRLLSSFSNQAIDQDKNPLETYLQHEFQKNALVKKDDIGLLFKILNQLPFNAIEIFKQDSGVGEYFNAFKEVLGDIHREIKKEKKSHIPLHRGDIQTRIDINLEISSINEKQTFEDVFDILSQGNVLKEYNLNYALENEEDCMHRMTGLFLGNPVQECLSKNNGVVDYLYKEKKYNKIEDILKENINDLLISKDCMGALTYIFDKLSPENIEEFKEQTNINQQQFLNLKKTMEEIYKNVKEVKQELGHKEGSEEYLENEREYNDKILKEYNKKRLPNARTTLIESFKKLDILEREEKLPPEDKTLRYGSIPQVYTDIGCRYAGVIRAVNDTRPEEEYQEILHDVNKELGIDNVRKILDNEKAKSAFESTLKYKYNQKTIKNITKNVEEILKFSGDVKKIDDFLKKNIEEMNKVGHLEYDIEHLFKDDNQIERRLLGVVHSKPIQYFQDALVFDGQYIDMSEIYNMTKGFSDKKKQNIRDIHNMLQNLQDTELETFKNEYKLDDIKFEKVKETFEKVFNIISGNDGASSSRASNPPTRPAPPPLSDHEVIENKARKTLGVDKYVSLDGILQAKDKILEECAENVFPKKSKDEAIALFEKGLKIVTNARHRQESDLDITPAEQKVLKKFGLEDEKYLDAQKAFNTLLIDHKALSEAREVINKALEQSGISKRITADDDISEILNVSPILYYTNHYTNEVKSSFQTLTDPPLSDLGIKYTVRQIENDAREILGVGADASLDDILKAKDDKLTAHIISVNPRSDAVEAFKERVKLFKKIKHSQISEQEQQYLKKFPWGNYEEDKTYDELENAYNTLYYDNEAVFEARKVINKVLQQAGIPKRITADTSRDDINEIWNKVSQEPYYTDEIGKEFEKLTDPPFSELVANHKTRQAEQKKQKEQEAYIPDNDLAILGLKKNADLAAVKKAYRTLSMKYHSDKIESKIINETFLQEHPEYKTVPLHPTTIKNRIKEEIRKEDGIDFNQLPHHEKIIQEAKENNAITNRITQDPALKTRLEEAERVSKQFIADIKIIFGKKFKEIDSAYKNLLKHPPY